MFGLVLQRVLGTKWFADGKKSLGELKEGGRIYVATTIANHI